MLSRRVQPAVDRMQGHTDYNGGYLQTRWTRTGANGSETVVQLSYDRTGIDYSTVAGVMQNLTFDFQKRSGPSLLPDLQNPRPLL